jgi:2-amino-4-hydroxy-6-hydroxymethyldihydropteridine diphosphokinase
VVELIVSTGSNLGDRHAHLTRAVEELEAILGLASGKSSIVESEPWGFDGNGFLNQILVFETDITAADCMHELLRIEAKMGRLRAGKGYSNRSIDLDIIAYGNKIIDFPDLKVPHPLMNERRFILQPLAQIRPKWMHPIFKKSSHELLDLCLDSGTVTVYTCDTTI